MGDRELVAGRELDALIAERVMGWTGVRVMPAGQLRGVNPVFANVQTDYDKRHNIPSRKIQVPFYSTVLGDAITIVARMSALFGYANLSLHDRQDAVGKSWVADLNAFGPVEAATAPLAICLCALAALSSSPPNLEDHEK